MIKKIILEYAAVPVHMTAADILRVVGDVLVSKGQLTEIQRRDLVSKLVQNEIVTRAVDSILTDIISTP